MALDEAAVLTPGRREAAKLITQTIPPTLTMHGTATIAQLRGRVAAFVSPLRPVALRLLRTPLTLVPGRR